MSAAALAADPGQPPTLREEAGTGGAASARVVVTGAWTLPMLAGRFAELEAEVESAASNTKTWDLHGISSLDGAGAVLLWRGWSHRRPMQLRLRAEHEAIFKALAAA